LSVFGDEGAHIQIFHYRQGPENTAALGYLNHAFLDDVMGSKFGEILIVQADRTFAGL
jgi:hypothetical protein